MIGQRPGRKFGPIFERGWGWGRGSGGGKRCRVVKRSPARGGKQGHRRRADAQAQQRPARRTWGSGAPGATAPRHRTRAGRRALPHRPATAAPIPAGPGDRDRMRWRPGTGRCRAGPGRVHGRCGPRARRTEVARCMRLGPRRRYDRPQRGACTEEGPRDCGLPRLRLRLSAASLKK